MSWSLLLRVKGENPPLSKHGQEQSPGLKTIITPSQEANRHCAWKNGSQAMCYVIAYDIPDDRRRTKVRQILMGFGKWTQYSLFECFLTRKDLILLQSKPGEHLINTEDSVRFYPLCASCVEKVETVGDPPPKDETLFIV